MTSRPDSPIPHGTNHAYSNRGCRCADCREAQRIYKADLRRRKRYGAYVEPRKKRHGL